MSEPKGKIVHQTGIPRETEFDFWEPVIFTKEDIDNEIERLAVAGQAFARDGDESAAIERPTRGRPRVHALPIRVKLDLGPHAVLALHIWPNKLLPF